MKLSSYIAVLIISIFAAVATTGYLGPKNNSAGLKETAFERVMRTGTLRCAYMIYPKFLERDPNTKAFSGVVYDVVNELASYMSWKVEWVEEIGTATGYEGFKTGRYDMACAGMTPTPGRLRVTDFSIPLTYLPFFAYTAANDTRFDNNYSAIDDPSIKVAFLEGEMGQIVKNQDFPKASSVSLQNLTGFSDVPLQVATGKADVAMGEPQEMDAFMEHNPGKLRQIAGPPLRMQPVTLELPVNEPALKNAVDQAIGLMRQTGFIKRTMDKYVGSAGHYYFDPAAPWQDNKGK
jgi:ABC-type amino acid transport substrate-binding protein